MQHATKDYGANSQSWSEASQLTDRTVQRYDQLSNESSSVRVHVSVDIYLLSLIIWLRQAERDAQCIYASSRLGRNTFRAG